MHKGNHHLADEREPHIAATRHHTKHALHQSFGYTMGPKPQKHRPTGAISHFIPASITTTVTASAKGYPRVVEPLELENT